MNVVNVSFLSMMSPLSSQQPPSVIVLHGKNVNGLNVNNRVSVVNLNKCITYGIIA